MRAHITIPAFLLGATIAMTGAYSSASAQGWVCPGPAAPAVQVTAVTGEIGLSRAQTSRDLTHMQGDRLEDGSHVNGLGGGSIGVEGIASFRISQQGGRACIALKGIDARFYAYPSIQIASNLPEGSCEYAAVLEHEMRHVQALNDFHAEYKGVFERELHLIAKRIAPKGPIPLAHIESEQRRMNDIISRQIRSFNSRILPVLERRQSAIDSPEEYARVQSLCSGWSRYFR